MTSALECSVRKIRITYLWPHTWKVERNLVKAGCIVQIVRAMLRREMWRTQGWLIERAAGCLRISDPFRETFSPTGNVLRALSLTAHRLSLLLCIRSGHARKNPAHIIILINSSVRHSRLWPQSSSRLPHFAALHYTKTLSIKTQQENNRITQSLTNLWHPDWDSGMILSFFFKIPVSCLWDGYHMLHV